jgi:hypothetical protein
MDIDPSLRDVLFLLIMYPQRSFKLNPWEVAQIFYSYQKLQKASRKSLSQAEDLPAVFQLFSNAFGTHASKLASYFASFYTTDHSTGKSVMQADVKKALLSPILKSMLSYKCVKLLASNQDLIKWGFLHVLSGQNAHSSHIFQSYVIPFLTQTEDSQTSSELATTSTYSLPEAAALRWAQSVVGLDEGEARHVMSETQVFNTDTAQSSLTFSVFVVFALRCFYKVDISDSEPSEAGERAGRAFLEVLSKKLTQLQQQLRVNVLRPLLQTPDTLISRQEQDALLHCCIGLFEKLPSRSGEAHPMWGFLPPVPPAIFWDAPRIVDFMRFVGVVERSGSLSTAWVAFGSFLRQSEGGENGWGANVVPPSPIKQDICAIREVLFGICEMCSDEDDAWLTTRDSKMAVGDVFTSYVNSTVLPIAVAHVEKGYFLNKVQPQSELLLESVLRYGGARAIRSLFSAGMWLEAAYEEFCLPLQVNSRRADSAEVPLLRAVKFMSCFGLLSLDMVTDQARCSLHSRSRIIADVTNITMSFPEFEELFLRCALCCWSISREGTVIPNVKYAMHEDIANKYFQACSKPSNDVISSKTWGIDFVTAFANTLHAMVDAYIDGSESYASLSSYIDVSKSALQNLATIEEHIEHESFEQVMEAGDNFAHESTTGESDQEIIDSEPHINAIKSLAATDQVKTKADALLRDILAARKEGTSSPTRGSSVGDDHDEDLTIVTAGSRTNHGLSLAPPQSPTRSLLAGTKEALWPVYGTYCSCGDSVNPGKLSGPNLFALLSKLGVLTDQTVLSDIGILLHQISAHTNSSSVSIAAATSSENFESPSLSFEEFLVFLCAFAQLRFDGSVSAPILSGKRDGNEKLSNANSQNTEVWFHNWKTFMGNSGAFRRLMEESVLPMLQLHPLIAHPEDARQRDKYSPVFSLEVLLAIEGSEGKLQRAYQDRAKDNVVFTVSEAVVLLRAIGLIPTVASEAEVVNVAKDVAPEGRISRSSSPTARGSPIQLINSGTSSPVGNDSRTAPEGMTFPQWEWIVCVVAHQGVAMAIADCEAVTPMHKIPELVKTFVTQIANSVDYVMNNPI